MNGGVIKKGWNDGRVMRQRASWMKPADDPILEYIHVAGEVNPAVIARNTDLHRKYASERCRELAEYNLLESTGDGYYKLTQQGSAYLEGDLDAGNLIKDT